jgi:S-adenosylmethionine synthetase
MFMQLRVTPLSSASPANLRFEIVERKGFGHPDTLCDLLAEAVSIGLSRFYLERFGTVLHHNVDKALLLGGAAQPAFGGGEVIEPIEITLGGRATRRLDGVIIPVEELAFETARKWLEANVHNLEPTQVRVVTRIRETSPDLAALFLRRSVNGAPLANDTSVGVGFAPLDRLERTVLAIERHLASEDVKRAYPEIGDDVKVLGLRIENTLEITLACAFVGRHVRDVDDYRRKKERLRSLVKAAALEAAGGSVEVDVNAADGDTADSIYLTVTGLSAEAGDDGQVGRGNRVNGLITPYRPMSLEAAAGKNPLTHTGKIYNLLAERICRALTAEMPGVEEAYCYLVSRIGSPLDEPQIVDVGLRLSDPAEIGRLESPAEELVRAHLHRAGELWHEVIGGRTMVC